MTPKERSRRVAVLAGLAGLIRDSELARLGASHAQLHAAESRRADLHAAIAHEVQYAAEAGGVPEHAALDMHLVLALQARDALDARLAGLAAERDVARRRAALAFGRAEALARLRARQSLLTGGGKC
jgi:hypothetical protein